MLTESAPDARGFNVGLAKFRQRNVRPLAFAARRNLAVSLRPPTDCTDCVDGLTDCVVGLYEYQAGRLVQRTAVTLSSSGHRDATLVGAHGCALWVVRLTWYTLGAPTLRNQ